MLIDEFFNKYNGVGLDVDGAYGNQCVDVFQAYDHEVVGGQAPSRNAIDYWTNSDLNLYEKVENTPDGVPQKGDVVIWHVGQFGHIAIFSSGDVNEFISFDQNWPTNVNSDGVGLGVCHFQPHTYVNVVGWLRPRTAPQPTQPQPVQPTLPEDELRALQVLRDEHVKHPQFQQLEALARDLVEKYEHPVLTPSPPVVTTVYTDNEPVFKSSLAKTLYAWAKSLDK